MKLIIITPEMDTPHEIESIKLLLNAGVVVHVRKKDKSSKALHTYLNQFSIEERKMLTLHGFHQIAKELQVGGIHLSGQEDVNDLAFWEHRKSKSIHSLEEVTNTAFNALDYCLLSPIYDSISKQNYQAGFDLEELQKVLHERTSSFPIVALGGITLDKIKELEQMHFSGAAILGDFWGKESLAERNQYIHQLKSYVPN